MKNELSYWSPLLKLRRQLHCWVRVAWRLDSSLEEGQWGQILLIPTTGYLEGPDGPLPLHNVEWIEVSTNLVKGGLGGRPLEMIDVKEKILSELYKTKFDWELRETTWSIEGIFNEEPVQVVRIINPSGSTYLT